jgi:energy-coupling factor transport system substrate-specific component
MLGSWNLREMVMVAVLAVVFGILYLWWIPVGALAAGLGGPVAREPLFGFWLIAAVVAGYIVQKPGAALIAELLAAFTEMLAGSSGGLIVLVWGFVQGIGIEAVFLTTGYRKFSAPVVMLGGAASAAAAFAFQWVAYGYANIDPTIVIVMLVLRVLSGAILAGLGGKYLAEALAATGVLSGFALGQQWLERRRQAVEG